MTVQKAMRLWGVSDTTITKGIRAGIIPAEKRAHPNSGVPQWEISDEYTSYEPFRKALMMKRVGIEQSKQMHLSDEEFVLANSRTMSIVDIAKMRGLSTKQVKALFESALRRKRNGKTAF